MWLSAKLLSSIPEDRCLTKITLWALLTIIALYLPAETHAQEPIQNNAFQPGERLTYQVRYDSPLGKFTAGTASVELEASSWKGNPAYHVTGIGETNSFFDMFYKVRDRFESFLDRETLLPYEFIRRTREGDYVLDDEVIFDHANGIVTSRRARKYIPENARDIISAVYFMRTLSVDDFGADSTYYINFYLDDSLYHSEVRYAGRDLLETKWGFLKCLKVIPTVVTGEVFSQKYPMMVWVTDDLNHIPVMAESEIIVGSVKMELTDYRNLKNPFIKPLTNKEIRKWNKNH